MHQETLGLHVAPGANMRASGRREGYVTLPPGHVASLPRMPGSLIPSRRRLHSGTVIRESVFRLGQRAPPAHTVSVAAIHARRSMTWTIGRLHGIRSMRAGIAIAAGGATKTGDVGHGRKASSRAGPICSAEVSAGYWAPMFERVPIAGELAGVCHVGGSERLCAVARAAAADRGGVPSRGVRHAGGDERRYPWGT
jgi:hypothetical protein